MEGYAKMQVLACKTGLICKIIEPSGFKNKILSTHKAPSHIKTKFLLDQTLFVGAPNMPNCVASKFQRIENVLSAKLKFLIINSKVNDVNS